MPETQFETELTGRNAEIACTLGAQVPAPSTNQVKGVQDNGEKLEAEHNTPHDEPSVVAPGTGVDRCDSEVAVSAGQKVDADCDVSLAKPSTRRRGRGRPKRDTNATDDFRRGTAAVELSRFRLPTSRQIAIAERKSRDDSSNFSLPSKLF